MRVDAMSRPHHLTRHDSSLGFGLCECVREKERLRAALEEPRHVIWFQSGFATKGRTCLQQKRREEKGRKKKRWPNRKRKAMGS